MIAVIARHESASLLRSPLIWFIAALLAGLFGFLFLQQLEHYLNIQSQLALQDHPPGLTGWMAARFLAPLAMVLSIIGPLFAMRSFSDEFRLQTWPLWQSSPVSSTSLVIGKYLGVYLIMVALVLLAVLMVGFMRWFVPVDVGVLASSALGLLLCAAACTATGLYFSSLTRQAMVAVLASLALLLVLWLIGSASVGGLSLAVLEGLSMSTHIASFFQGYLHSGDILWFVLFTVLFLLLTIIRLDALRHTGV